jgi:hypothetical protein
VRRERSDVLPDFPSPGPLPGGERGKCDVAMLFRLSPGNRRGDALSPLTGEVDAAMLFHLSPSGEVDARSAAGEG